MGLKLLDPNQRRTCRSVTIQGCSTGWTCANCVNGVTTILRCLQARNQMEDQEGEQEYADNESDSRGNTESTHSRSQHVLPHQEL